MGGPKSRENKRREPSKEPKRSKIEKFFGNNIDTYAFIISILLFIFIVSIAFCYKEYVERILTVILSLFAGLVGYFGGALSKKNDS